MFKSITQKFGTDLVVKIRSIVATSESYIINDMGIGVNSDSNGINETIDFFHRIRLVRPRADDHKSSNLLIIPSEKLDERSMEVNAGYVEESTPVFSKRVMERGR